MARKVPIPREGKVDQTFDELLFSGLLVPVEVGGVENCSPVVWVKKGEKLRMCVGYKVNMTDKIKIEAYPVPCIGTFFSKISGIWRKLTFQMLNGKLNWTKSLKQFLSWIQPEDYSKLPGHNKDPQNQP